MTLPEFLERWPWPAPWAEAPGRLDWLWNFDLPADPRRLWPFIADTSAFNRRLGLGEMTFTEKDGALHGRATSAGIRLEWVESPWEWDYARSLSNTRTYSRGFARFVRARYALEEAGPGRTRLTVYFGWAPRGLAGRLLLAASEGWMRGHHGRAADEARGGGRRGERDRDERGSASTTPMARRGAARTPAEARPSKPRAHCSGTWPKRPTRTCCACACAAWPASGGRRLGPCCGRRCTPRAAAC